MRPHLRRVPQGRRCRTSRRASLGATACVAALCVAGPACGTESEQPAPRPADVAEYGALADGDRTAAARACRDAMADLASGLAARQIAQVRPALLRTELDLGTSAKEHVSFRSACATALPAVTPGLRVRFAGATGNGRSFAYPTRSDRPLTIRGAVEPAPRAGRVVARRLVGSAHPRPAQIDASGRFVFRDIPLRKMADNTFVLRIEAPPNAPRVVRFSALCLDCGAATAAPAPAP